MFRARRLVTGAAFMVVLVLSSAISVSAQQPDPPPAADKPPLGPNPAPAAVPAAVVKDEPGAANALGAAMNTIPANSALWFRFEYDAAGYQAPHPTVTVRLLNGLSNGLAFEIWSAERLQGNWKQNNPVGRGTQQVLPSCEEPEEEGGEGEAGGAGGAGEAGGGGEETASAPTSPSCGRFETNDLTWTGGFGGSGTYFIRLVNPTNAPLVPQMLIGGAGMVSCAGAKLDLPAIGHVPAQDEAFVRVQCMDVGPGLVEGEGEGGASQAEEE